MPLFSFEGLTPQIHATAFVAPTATLVGDVIVEEGASVWYGAVIRADYAPVIVRRRANVQDNAVIHGPPGLTTDVGPGVTVAHNCVVHGALLERGVHHRQRLGRARRRDHRRRRAHRRGLGRRGGHVDSGRDARGGLARGRAAPGQGQRRRDLGRDATPAPTPSSANATAAASPSSTAKNRTDRSSRSERSRQR